MVKKRKYSLIQSKIIGEMGDTYPLLYVESKYWPSTVEALYKIETQSPFLIP